MTAKSAERLLASESNVLSSDVPAPFVSSNTFSNFSDRQMAHRASTEHSLQSRSRLDQQLNPPIEDMFTTISPYASAGEGEVSASGTGAPLDPLRARLLHMARLHQAIGELA